ncbi:MAG: hypothetical protein G01um101429_521 [Parcubacteria group bacterium Gr01-1014_29]|nr:MAG: hypothetical protein G01um101429_521 [Parcubacteria group bacterium Gr01-1014_29]
MIWFIRRVLPLLLLETTAVWFAVQNIAEHVFVNNVLQNAVVHTFSRSPVMIIEFFFRAFLNTETLVQLFILASLVVGTFIARDALRTIRNFSPLSRVI